MGAALATIGLVLAGASLQGAPPSTWKEEYKRIQAQLELAGSREEGRLALHRFVERLRADPDVEPGALYHRAKALAADCTLTPDPRARAQWYDVASGAAVRAGLADAALWMQEERARLVAALGANDEAAAILERGLARHSNAWARRPHALVALADLQRGLGQFDAAAECAAEAEAAADGEPSARIARDLALLVRSAIARDVGSPEAVEPELEALASDTAQRLASGEIDAAHATSVRIELLRATIARGDHARVRRDAQALLDDPVLCRADAERARVLLLLGASWLEFAHASAGADELAAQRARDAFEGVLRLDPEPADAFFVRTRLAADALERGDRARCADEIRSLRAIPQSSVPLTTRVERSVLEARFALTTSSTPAELRERRADLQAAWDDLVRAWRSAPRHAEGVPFLKYSHRRSVLSELVRIELALAPGESGIERAFDHVLGAQELSALALARPGARATLADLRRVLLQDPLHGLLVYLPARDLSHVFAVDGSSITHHVLHRSARLEEARKQYVAWLLLDGAEASTGTEREELVREERLRAAALSEVLLPEDVRARLRPWRRWSISGTDSLGLVPLEWLPFGDERHLGLERALDFVPSLPHAVRRAKRAVHAPREIDLVLVDDARPGAAVEARWPGLERADLGEATRDVLADAYGSERVRVLAAERASAAELGELDWSRVSVLQFAVHAVEERERPVPVALALSPSAGHPSDEGLFRAEDVARLAGAPELVVMTACGSGRGPTRRGDPLVGTATWAWLAHDVRAVVVSQRALTLREARRTTRVLHGALRGGAGAAEALMEVRRDLARDERELAPFAHALQQVVGSGHEPLFPREQVAPVATAPDGTPRSGPGGRLALLAAGIALTIVALMLVRRRTARRRTSDA